MKYYLIAGEASGDLHASRLMDAIRHEDANAKFRFIGGDNMSAIGGDLLFHYKDIAYMGFIPVLLHLHTIFRVMRICKEDITAWQPDVLILVDYPGFNLEIAKYIHDNTHIPVFYYISPKIWAWKEFRIKSIKKNVKEIFSILPFEIDFYNRHQYAIHYVGNPTVEEVKTFQTENKESFEAFTSKNGLSSLPIIALLAGSRKQEIKDNLPDMLRAAESFSDYQIILAGAPSIDESYYRQFIEGKDITILFGQTYNILQQASAALVTSGTATLETALFGVPQVVCYHTPIGKIIAFLKRHFLKVKYISLVNLILDHEAVRELVADKMTVSEMRSELDKLLHDPSYRSTIHQDYNRMNSILGDSTASATAANQMIQLLTHYNIESPCQTK